MSADRDLVQLRTGEQHTVRLAGLGTAGYRWGLEDGGDETVARVNPAGVQEPESEAVGVSGAELFTVHALRPGVTRLRFAQRRPWESREQAPAREHLVELRVSAR